MAGKRGFDSSEFDKAFASGEIVTMSPEELVKAFASKKAKELTGGSMVKLEIGQSVVGLFVGAEEMTRYDKKEKKDKKIPVYVLDCGGQKKRILGSTKIAQALGENKVKPGSKIAIARCGPDVKTGAGFKMQDIRVFAL